MKTVINSTNIVRGQGLVYLLISIFSFSFFSFSIAGSIVNIASIKVSKNYPASFVLELEQNDIVTVKYSFLGGSADINQLEVKVFDLNQQDEEEIANFNRSGRDFLAEYDGIYRVDFIYTGKGSGFFKQRNLDLSISMELDGYEGLQEGESKEILRMTNCVIEETVDNSLRINYYFTEGDNITISSQDSKSAFLKLQVTQLAKMYSLRGPTVINIPSDGTYSFKFYLEADDDGSLFNWKELLKKSDFLFNDLSIFRERAVTFVASNSGNSSASEEDEMEESSPTAIDNTTDYLAELQKSLAAGNASQDEITKMMAEAMQKSAEQAAAIQEMLNKKNVRTEVYSTPNEVSFILEPEFNFAKDNENRKCEVLPIPPSRGFDFWVYWVGVGENAEKAFEEHNEEIKRTYKKSLPDASAEYVFAKFSGGQTNKRNPSFPNERKYPQYLQEDAEYAIVDFNNKEKFLRGERYFKINTPTNRAKYVTSDHGISSRVANQEDIYFCACNNNKSTPVNVFFKFFTIDYEEIEY